MILGMVQTIAVEARELNPATVDLPLESTIETDIDFLLSCLHSKDNESHFLLRAGKRSVLRLKKSTESSSQYPLIHNDGSYVITGGVGGLGLLFGRWLCEHGAGHVHLLGRNEPVQETQATLSTWRSKYDCHVTFHKVDIANASMLSEVIQQIDAGAHRLRGVLHLAGINLDKAIVNQTWQDFELAAAPKVKGSLNLHHAVEGIDLDWFVGFSSVASVLGSPGQANYGMANAFLDSLMHYRKAMGLKGLSLNWGPWTNVGMTSRMAPEKLRRWETTGVQTIDAELGTVLLGQLLGSDAPQYVVVPADWSRLLRLFPPGLQPSLLTDFVDERRVLRSASNEWRSLKTRVSSQPKRQKLDVVTTFLEQLVRDVLNLPAEVGFDRTAGFVDLGMDSLMGVELRNLLQNHLGNEMILSATIVFNHPNVQSMAEYLVDELLADGTKSILRPKNLDKRQQDESVAIVGCGMRFPGGVTNLDSYWKLLQAGAIAIDEIPISRWDNRIYYDPDPDLPGHMNTRWAGVMQEIESFDAAFFGISPREAIKMDPQHRVILETMWAALENACIPPSSLLGSQTGIYLGICGNDYASLFHRTRTAEDIDAYLAVGNAHQLAAGRASHIFGTHGPSLAIDTACSSSLVAIHLACESLRTGESSVALAGGVNVLLAPEISISLSKAHMMAPDGRCKTFSDDADGYVRSEGCGVVVLKRLSDAIESGDPILGIIRGTAVNHDGRCSAVTVPNGASQAALIRQSLSRANLQPDQIDYVEAHGTGTSLGDPIELEALASVFAGRNTVQNKLTVGSVKANIGHLEAAAGIAGMLKLLAMFRHSQIPPQPPIRKLNSHVEWKGLPLQISLENREWKSVDRKRVAGISSFSFGGTNAHIVVEEPPSRVSFKEGTTSEKRFVVVLSGKTTDALDDQIRQLARALGSQEIGDVAYSLSSGRDHFQYRIATLASTTAELKVTLEEFAKTSTSDLVRNSSVQLSDLPSVVFLCNTISGDVLSVASRLANSHPEIKERFEHAVGSLEYSEQDFATSPTTWLTVQSIVVQALLGRVWQDWLDGSLVFSGIGKYWFAASAAAGRISIQDAVRLAIAYEGLDSRSEATAWEHQLAAVERLESDGLLLTSDGDYINQTAHWDKVTNQLFRDKKVSVSLNDPLIVLSVSPLDASETKFNTDTKTIWLNLTDSIECSPERWLQELYLRGVKIDWRAYWGSRQSSVELPSYPFARKRYWLDVDETKPSLQHAVIESISHPFFGRRLRGPTIKGMVFEQALCAKGSLLLQDHKIYSMVVVPGAFHLAAVISAAISEKNASVELSNVVFPEALMLPDNSIRPYQLVFEEKESERGAFAFKAFSSADSSDRWNVHCEGTLRWLDETAAIPDKAIEAIPTIGDGKIELRGEFFYSLLAQYGIELGGEFQWLDHIRRGEHQAIAQTRKPSAKDTAYTMIPPGLIDSCFQMMAACVEQNDVERNAYIPVRLERFVAYRPVESSGIMVANLKEKDVANKSSLTGDLRLLSDQGQTLFEMSGVGVRRAQRSVMMQFAQKQVTDIFYETRWEEVPLHTADANPTSNATRISNWLLLSDRTSLADRIAKSLNIENVNCEWLYPSESKVDEVLPERLNHLLQDLNADFKGVIYFPTQPEHSQDDDVNDLMQDQRKYCGEIADLVKTLSASKLPHNSRLVIVTERSLAIEVDGDWNPCNHTISGLLNVVRNEQPFLRCMHIDLENDSDVSANFVFQELIAAYAPEMEREDQVSYRGGKRRVPRLERQVIAQKATQAGIEFDLSLPYQLIPGKNASLAGMSLLSRERRNPGLGEVEIQINSTGLNFRDVLNALGLYPGDAGALGVECAGTVTAVGAGLSWPKLGDRVVALAPAAFSQYTNTDSRLVAPLSDDISFESGAAVPVVYLTADYALRRVAKLRSGESILIHAGTGGVGIAAIQIAKKIGANIYATAGSEEKRQALRDMGVVGVFDSRNTNFSEQLLAQRNGCGVDVVLNSLAGDFIDHSLRTLASAGRFVEIGKIGIWSKEEVSAVLPHVQYHVFALDHLTMEHPGEVGIALRELMAELTRKELPLIRTQSFEMSEVKNAFHYMAQAKHTGKIVIKHPEPKPSRSVVVDDGGYLVTGGLGGIGLIVAKWLFEQGAGRILLCSRSAPSPEVETDLNSLRLRGADIRVCQTDVTNYDEVIASLTNFDDQYPLRGIIHAAGVLDDVLLSNMTWDKFDRVLRPKLLGAVNLHRASLKMELDFFAMFSSIASVIGSQGQANYAAANAFLDGLAFYRRAMNLPAVTINWGPWEEAGMAARQSSTLTKQWQKMGLSLLSTDQCLFALEKSLLNGSPQNVILAVDWEKLGNQFPLGAEPRMIRRLLSSKRAQSGPSPEWKKLIENIKVTPAPQRLEKLVDFICSEARDVLNQSSDYSLDPRLPFNEYGFDSLMAVELASRLAMQSGISLPVTLLFDHPTIESLARHVLTDELGLLPKAKEVPLVKTKQSVDEFTSQLLLEIESMTDSSNVNVDADEPSE